MNSISKLDYVNLCAAASSDPGRPGLGWPFQDGGDLVATDGFRLHSYRTEAPGPRRYLEPLRKVRKAERAEPAELRVCASAPDAVRIPDWRGAVPDAAEDAYTAIAPYLTAPTRRRLTYEFWTKKRLRTVAQDDVCLVLEDGAVYAVLAELLPPTFSSADVVMVRGAFWADAVRYVCTARKEKGEDPWWDFTNVTVRVADSHSPIVLTRGPRTAVVMPYLI